MSINWSDLLIKTTTSTSAFPIPSSDEIYSFSRFGSYYGPIQNKIVKSTSMNYIEIGYPSNGSVAMYSESQLIGKSVLVGFHLQIIDGTFNLDDCNGDIPGDYESLILGHKMIYRKVGRPISDVPPGPIIYENVKLVSMSDSQFDRNDRLIPSQHILSLMDKIDIPDGIFIEGHSYTARTRSIIAYPYIQGDNIDPKWYVFENYARPFYTKWGISQISINKKPTIINQMVNKSINPEKIPSKELISISFTIKNEDGPRLKYKLQVGSMNYGQFVPSMLDTNWTSLENILGLVDVTVPYQGERLYKGTTYYWRVRANDGLSDGEWSNINTFSINDPPKIKSIKIDGKEILFGKVEKAKSDGAVISWEYYDTENIQQKYYKLFYRQSNWSYEEKIIGYDASNSITLPNFEKGQEIYIRLIVSDGTEEIGEKVKFIANNTPMVSQIKIENRINPTNISNLSPEIAWSYQDLDSEIQQGFRIQVSTDFNFSNLVWDTGNKSGIISMVVYGSTSSPIVPPSPLIHSVYFVRISVSDGISWSSLEDCPPSFFAINSKPNTPILFSPTSGLYSGSIDIRWIPATPVDPDGDIVTYKLEITNNRSSNLGWKLLVGPLPQTQNSYIIGPDDFPSGDNYGVRIIASDGMSESDSSSVSTSQRFSIDNHAPITPIFTSPSTGQIISNSLVIEWIESSPPDIDEDFVYYIIEITNKASIVNPIWNTMGIVRSGTSLYRSDVSDFENGTDYQLRITSVDEHGKKGQINLSPKFTIDNSSKISDMEYLNGNNYMTTTDGKILKLRQFSWQIDEDWSGQDIIKNFSIFATSGAKVKLIGGEIIFDNPKGETAIIREGK